MTGAEGCYQIYGARPKNIYINLRGGSIVAGRPSVVLREQLEDAKRHAETHGSLALIVQVRVNVDVAIDIARERLGAVRRASDTSSEAAPLTRPSAWLGEEAALRDELAELRRLRNHLKALMGSNDRSF
jgi:hypothetical protein